MELSRLVLCAVLLAPLAAAAQDDPATEAAPAEEAPAEEASDQEAPVTEEEVAGAAEEPSEALTGHYADLYSIPVTAYTFKAPGALGPTERGDGMGARAMYRVFSSLAVTADYATRTFDDTDQDLTETSAGIGATVHNANGDLAGLFVEYDKLDFEITELDGYSVHGRLIRQPSSGFNFNGDIGYVFLQDDAEDREGIELTLGIGYCWGLLNVFAGWHFLDLEGQDSGERAQLSDARAGVRVSF